MFAYAPSTIAGANTFQFVVPNLSRRSRKPPHSTISAHSVELAAQDADGALNLRATLGFGLRQTVNHRRIVDRDWRPGNCRSDVLRSKDQKARSEFDAWMRPCSALTKEDGIEMAGQLIDDRFEVREPLRKSSGGVVTYIARDVQTGEPAFLKLLHPTSSADSNEVLQRRMQEYQVLRKINHPNAVRVIKAGLTAENAFYVAMEYLQDRRLSQVVDEEGALSAERTADMLDQVAGVLDVAHSYGIVHRDVQMGNILVQVDEAGQESCKLIGFASAKDLVDRGQENMTQAGVAMGTPTYMSPEQAIGKSVTKLADVYSLGVTLYATLTGKLPFEGKNDVQIMFAHVKEPVPPFTDRNPDVAVPAVVERVVRQAMCKEPAYRLSSAGELARMFREAVTNPDAEPEGLSKLEQSGAAAGRSAAARQTEAEPEEDNPYRMIPLYLAAIAIGALLGYVLS